ncbi:hypothetical protein BT69DRAFT_786576 [Atractiella rhizophila]|nr:hypothetical protein BT69DRAFT_786576 [Atractiella rhizophila]
MPSASKILVSALLFLSSTVAAQDGGIGASVQGFSTVQGTPAAATPASSSSDDASAAKATPAPIVNGDSGSGGIGASPLGPVSTGVFPASASAGGVLGVDGGSSGDSSSSSKEDPKATITASAKGSEETSSESSSCSGDCCNNDCGSSDNSGMSMEYGGCSGYGCDSVGSYDCSMYDWYCDASYGYSHGYSKNEVLLRLYRQDSLYR